MIHTVPITRVDLYDGIAPAYDRLHARFLRSVGGSAQSALEGAVTALLRPGLSVLDAGCGTARLGRQLSVAEPSIDLTLLDAAPAMLHRSRHLAARRVHGSLDALPFANVSFGLTVCAWAIETVPDVNAALAELTRVTAPGGHLCLAFCADVPNGTLIDRLMVNAVQARGTGRFLDPAEIVATLRRNPAWHVRRVSCPGPAAVIVAERVQ